MFHLHHLENGLEGDTVEGKEKSNSNSHGVPVANDEDLTEGSGSGDGQKGQGENKEATLSGSDHWAGGEGGPGLALQGGGDQGRVLTWDPGHPASLLGES